MITYFLGSARIFASHYQLVICEDPEHALDDTENWNDESFARGFSGARSFRMVRTEADLNDHWVELVFSQKPPSRNDWQRITCVDFITSNGAVHVMSIVDDEPLISTKVAHGEYSAYFAAQNIGIDPVRLDEASDVQTEQLADEQLAALKNSEWYRIYLVPGRQEQRGRLIDRIRPAQ